MRCPQLLTHFNLLRSRYFREHTVFIRLQITLFSKRKRHFTSIQTIRKFSSSVMATTSTYGWRKFSLIMFHLQNVHPRINDKYAGNSSLKGALEITHALLCRKSGFRRTKSVRFQYQVASRLQYRLCISGIIGYLKSTEIFLVVIMLRVSVLLRRHRYVILINPHTLQRSSTFQYVTENVALLVQYSLHSVHRGPFYENYMVT
jgi:hypothetical protein